ncbi:hypothetical protein [Pedobacter heparinus]|uniref:hypothetical protein n=1 Tax=Pedobacter heparinus TaxID=984 RepID=UPI0029304096|nr:hypothetical protein [Pedobacter heparinus]
MRLLVKTNTYSLLMMETFTSIDNLNYQQQKQDSSAADETEGMDTMFYDHLKAPLNALKRDPADETIARILAYSKSSVI